MRGAATIRPSLPDSFSPGITRPASESGERTGDAVLPALESENDELDTWLPAEPGVGATWLSGILAGLGVLGALLCDMVGLAGTLGAGLDETLGEGLGGGVCVGLLGAALGGGLGGGLLGALLVEECCENTAGENRNTTATTRLESRIKHPSTNHG